MSRTEDPAVPDFTIVVPLRAMPGLVGGAIDSVLRQEIGGRRVNAGTTPDVELVVVVDDLDPQTRAVLTCFGDAIRWVEGDGRGQAAAVNKGLRLTSGRIVKWLNADDRLLPGALQRVRDGFRAEPGADFLYGDVEFHDAAGRIAAKHLEPRYSRFVLLYGHNLFADPACFWRRSLHHRVGDIAEDTRYSLDYDFWVRLALSKTVVTQVRHPLAAFTVSGNNMSVVHRREMVLEHFDVLARHDPRWGRLPQRRRNAILSALMPAARMVKVVNCLLQRGHSSVRGFARLARRSARSS